jgi:hypothetical protein
MSNFLLKFGTLYTLIEKLTLLCYPGLFLQALISQIKSEHFVPCFVITIKYKLGNLDLDNNSSYLIDKQQCSVLKSNNICRIFALRTSKTDQSFGCLGLKSVDNHFLR